VAARSFRTSDYATMIEEVRPGCPDLRWVVLLGSADWLALPDSGGDPRALAATLAARQALLSPDDPINIQYTSGTTGHPKGATLSHHNILNNAHLTGEILGYTELDRICVPVPLYHKFGMVIGNLGATTHGACLVYPAPAFDPAATLAAVEEERCTSLYGVPAMFIAELAQAGFDAYDLSSLRTGGMGGAPCPVEVMKQVVDRMGMTEITIVYGMTETSPVSAQTRVDDTLDRRVSTPRRTRVDRGRRPGIRRRKAGPLQDPALRSDRRGLPDDGERQGPQGRDARGRRQHAGAHRYRGIPVRVITSEAP
jgi:fatty-acyl-CoA synthase